jgi:hypothetical protein
VRGRLADALASGSLTPLADADPIASLLIAALIFPRTWQLLRQAADVLLEATPTDVDLEEVRRHMLGTQGVIDVHDLYAWRITSGVNVMSAHVVVNAEDLGGRVLDQLGAGTCCERRHPSSAALAGGARSPRWQPPARRAPSVYLSTAGLIAQVRAACNCGPDTLGL